MTEREHGLEQPKLEAPYVTAVKARVGELVWPEQSQEFNSFFDLINQELMGQGEGKGLFVWESKKYSGVKFLAGHIHIDEDWVKRLSKSEIKDLPIKKRRRIKSYARFIQPALGGGKDGSGLSALDMAFSPALDITHTIATAIKNGEEPPTGDIYLLGSPTAIGGKTTLMFNVRINASRLQDLGFDPYGEIYAEFMQDHLPKNVEELQSTKVVLEGISKGAITADKTANHLIDEVKKRTQVLLDNPAGIHGNSLPTKIGRGANMLLFLVEAGVREKITRNITGRTLSKTQPQFYRDITQKLNLEEDSEEQKKLKGELAKFEYLTLWHGNPINKKEKKYIKVSSPDTANSSFKAARRAFSLRFTEKPAIQDMMYQEGKVKIFPNSNNLHMWPWERSIKSGSWGRKLASIINTQAPVNVIEN